jgi:uncharacterized protein (DUF4415 family)
MQAKSKSGRVFDLPDGEEAKRIHAAALADPDAQPMTDEQLAQLRPLSEFKRSPGRPKAAVTKERVNIRLSPEVAAYFRATGRGWQTRVDKILKEYVEAHR